MKEWGKKITNRILRMHVNPPQAEFAEQWNFAGRYGDKVQLTVFDFPHATEQILGIL
jgi:hypothetical protein